ncbi:break repair meiotic recombinase recruitment factor 1 [Gavia stellata]|uniref:break repair meiotic recombinase recruitment factor 1 n=1 Tax=Gavia stellata TaxID=37040 RepID=UPI002896B2FE|nr:break repair meiotic recombinase recruitment factor 1 [Gavia stellata]
MGKRKNEQLPGGDSKRHVPKTKRNLQEDSEATGNDSLDMTGAAQTGDANRKLKPPAEWVEDRGETTHGSTSNPVTNAPRSANGDGEAAAPEQSRAGERIPSPLPQEGRDTGTSGGGKSLEAAVPGAPSQPQSPQRANSMADETEEDQPVVTAEQHRSAGEELDAETSTHRGTGSIGDSPEHGSAAPVREEGVAGREIPLPVDTPGQSSGNSMPAEVPEPRREEGVNRSELGECRGDTDQSQEPPRPSVVNGEENESSAISERAAGGEHWENMSGEQPRATGTNDMVKNAAESWCSLASGSVSISGVCALSADLKAGGSTAELERAGAAGTIGPVSRPQGGNISPRKTSGEANVGREEARGEETPSPETSSAPDPAVPAGGNPTGEREGEGLAEERDVEARCVTEHTDITPRTDTELPACSGNLPCSGGIAVSTPALTAIPGPAPTGTVQPPAASTSSAVGTDPRDETCSAGEPSSVLGGNSLELLPQQPLPAADRRNTVVPGREPRAAAGGSHGEEAPPLLAKGNGPDQLRPRGEEPEGLCPPACQEDATNVVRGLILELSNLNRLAMSAHRGLEALRRPKPRRSRRPGPVPPHAGRWRKET